MLNMWRDLAGSLGALVAFGGALKLRKRADQAILIAGHPWRTTKLGVALMGARTRHHAAWSLLPGFKFAGNYLATGLPHVARLDALFFHYHFLKGAMRNVPLIRGIALWSKTDDEGKLHEVVIRPSWLAPMEGELEACFQLDGKRLFTLTFAIVPGEIVGSADEATLFIGGLQGAYSAREEIRYAARMNDEIAPITMLLILVRAVARSFGIDRMTGISNDRQVAGTHIVDGRSSSFDYDELWTGNDGNRNAAGFFCIPSVEPIPADDQISGKHRSRTRRRRRSRQLVDQTMRDSLGHILRHPKSSVPVDPRVDAVHFRKLWTEGVILALFACPDLLNFGAVAAI